MSRRKRRYLNRQIKRQRQNTKTIEDVISLKSLYNACKKASRGVSWKASVQKSLLSILFKICKLRRKILEGKDIRQGFIEFDLYERGKARHIRSVHFTERIVQKSLCENVLTSTMTRNLIYDNCASQKGKGTHFAQARVEKFLHNYYNKHKTSDGYVLTIDFKNYFDNINHKILKKIIKNKLQDEDLRKLSYDFVDAFGEIGLGLGSETSQINAISYTNKIDHYIKDSMRCKYYCRYMDDSIIIHSSKEFLNRLYQTLKIMFEEYGIKINQKKTKILKLKQGFKFLKTKFYLTQTGKVIKKPCRDSITRERRKLKKQAKLYKRKILNTENIDISFNSWIGSMKKRHSRKTVYGMKNLYKELLKERNELCQ